MSTTVSGSKPLDLPPISVEATVTPHQLTQMLTRIEDIFTKHASERPHWTVATTPIYEPDQFEAHRNQFFQSGRDDVRTFQAFLARAGLSLPSYRSCFEFGCGVGRITVALAELFEQVIGADVALPMLVEAERTALAFNVANIRWLLTNRFNVYNSLSDYDVFFSVISLQHNPPPVISYLLTRLLTKLRSGGIGFFQLPTYHSAYSFSPEKYLSSPATNDIEVHCLPQRILFDLVRQSGCRLLEIREDGWVGPSMQTISNTLLVEKT